MRYFLSLGSNMPDKSEKLTEALVRLKASKVLSIERTTEFYETPDMAGGERHYLNAVVEIESDCGISRLNRMFKDMEKEMGRDRRARERGDVPIDIDIVTCGKEILRPKDFTAFFFRHGMQLLESHAGYER